MLKSIAFLTVAFSPSLPPAVERVEQRSAFGVSKLCELQALALMLLP